MGGTAAAMAFDPRSAREETISRNEAAASGVSWAAVAGGAFVAAALSLILLSLGAGLGLSSVSPWSNVGASASAIGTASVLWLIAMQIMSSAMGGYLAGRLRTKWASVHTDEVYFRDTVHGLLVWSVGIVMTAAFLTSAAVAMVGGAAPAVASQAAAADPNAYYVDTLFRSDRTGPERYDTAAHAEAAQIFANALRAKDISPTDKSYLAQIVAARTGIVQTDAERRVSDTLTEARQAADTARKAAAHLLLWLFIALLIGAFSASYAATIGGRQRDHVKAI